MTVRLWRGSGKVLSMLPSLLVKPTRRLTLEELQQQFTEAFDAFVNDFIVGPDECEFYVDGRDELWAFDGHLAYSWQPSWTADGRVEPGEWLSDPDNDDL